MGSRMFIAVQCCECWMMQVKQQKKSGNKWTCVVCNQKQSVRKVFAKGYMAKDLRQFVQSFNMSQSQKPQTLSHQLEEEEEQDKTKDTRDGLESRIGTEMPNKKPKLSINGAHTRDGEGEEYGSGERDSTICWPSMTKAVVSKWSKYLSEDDMEPETCQRAKVSSGSKGHTFITEDDEDDEDEEQKRARPPTMAMGMLKQNNYTQDDITPRSYQEKVAKAGLKWDNYLTEDGDGQQRSQWPTMAMGPLKEKNYLTPDDIEPRKTCQKKVAKAALQWNDYMTEAGEQGTRCPTKVTKVGKSASKWNSYLTQEEEDELQLVSWKKFRTDHLGK